MTHLLRTATVLTLLLLAAAPAALAGPVKDANYQDESGVRWLSLYVTVSPNGKSVKRMGFTLPTNCRIGNKRPSFPTTLDPPKPTAIKRDGTFSYRKVQRFPATGAVMTEWFKGRFARGGRSVTLSGRYTLKRPDGGCDTKLRKLVANLDGLEHGGPFPGAYSGMTKAGEPITLTVGATKLTNLRTRVTVTCDDHTSFVRDVNIATIALDQYDHFDEEGVGGAEGRAETFEVIGRVLVREFKDDPENSGDRLLCEGLAEFTITPARPLDS